MHSLKTFKTGVKLNMGVLREGPRRLTWFSIVCIRSLLLVVIGRLHNLFAHILKFGVQRIIFRVLVRVRGGVINRFA